MMRFYLKTLRWMLVMFASKRTRGMMEEMPEFVGWKEGYNQFSLFHSETEGVLVGGRNSVFNLSLPGLVEDAPERLDWPCSPTAEEMCLLKGKSGTDCQNYIRVHSFTSPGSRLVCGTHCFSPLCRHYQRGVGGYMVVVDEFSGQGYVPFQPEHNSSYLYTQGDLYAATVADFSGTDSLIIKNQLRTEQYDYMHLNAPDFVSTREDVDHVYFFFREAAIEAMNCGKQVYSRVARVCKSDEGGKHKFSNRWTTFLKSRLNCSLPGDYPFYFNEIQATTELHPDIVPTEGNHVFYALFTTPENALPGSAVCRFTTADITASFEAEFKNQETPDSNWLPLPPGAVPNPRPGRCDGSGINQTESNLHFIKNHCLMDKSVQSSPAGPVFVSATGSRELVTQLALVRGLEDWSGDIVDVLYLGTNRGSVGKVIVNSVHPDLTTTSLASWVQVLPPATPVLSLKIRWSETWDPLMVVAGQDIVRTVNLYQCDTASDCDGCLSPNNRPYCTWDMVDRKCKVWARMVGNIDGLLLDRDFCTPDYGPFYLAGPSHLEALSMENELRLTEMFNTTEAYTVPDSETEITSQLPEEITSDDFFWSLTQTIPNLVLVLVPTIFTSLLVGFLMGLLVSRLCRGRSHSVTSSNVSLVKQDPSSTPDSGYTTPTSVENKKLGELPVISTTQTKPRRFTTTLQRVKRVYL